MSDTQSLLTGCWERYDGARAHHPGPQPKPDPPATPVRNGHLDHVRAQVVPPEGEAAGILAADLEGDGHPLKRKGAVGGTACGKEAPTS
jgi:hypothetical protein